MADLDPPRTGEKGVCLGGIKKTDVAKQFCFLLTDDLYHWAG